jgi:hypothetical protein
MPAPTFTLSQEQYEALIAFARRGTLDADGAVIPEQSRQLDTYLKAIELDNDITRDAVWVQWQEMDQPLPAATSFPDTWPPEMRHYIEFITRRVARADVDAALTELARAPTNVLVTKDPAARLGWTPLDDFFTA